MAASQITDPVSIRASRATFMQWVSRAKNIQLLLAAFSIPLLILQCYTAFIFMGFYFAHDEAEHLHVVFALQRGEVPYRDFLENHPVLFHLVLLWLKQTFHLNEGMDVYWLGKSLVAVHFIACVGLLTFFFAGLAHRSGADKRAWLAAPLALVMLNIWTHGSLAYDPLWQLRPDWVCYFYALLCIALHHTFHRRLFLGEKPSWWPVVLGAVAGGFASAILAKSIYIFLPYALTFMLLALDRPAESLEKLRRCGRALIFFNLLFLGLGVVVYALLVLLELSFSGATLLDYYRANFLLNASIHLHDLSDTNPFNILRSFLGFPLLPTLGLAMGLALMALHFHRKHQMESFATLCFVAITILLNSMLPAYSNGQVLPQYFIPSLLVLMLFLAMGLSGLFRHVELLSSIAHRQGWPWCKRLPLAAILAMLTLLLFPLGQALEEHEAINAMDKLRERLTGDTKPFVVPEKYLPFDLTYLVFTPRSVPVAAKTWGYFFMLGPDKSFWVDNHTLGIGPNPKGFWRNLYAKQPPDAIALSGAAELQEKVSVLAGAQNVDISWLWPVMQADYRCLTRKTLSIYVRNELLPRMTGAGWKPCFENESAATDASR